jgi:hypothetical protein
MNSLPNPNQAIGKRFDTPRILRSGLYAVWGASLLLLLVSIAGVTSQRQAIKTVGKDAAPSILAAQQLRDSFADIDASLANELLLDPASKNITYPEEEKLLQTLQLRGSEYFLRLQEARDAKRRGDNVAALAVYRSGAEIVDRDLLPQAEQLDRVNYQALETSYNNQGVYNGAISLFTALIGLITLGILVAIQLFIYQRMRRILNLPLLGATAIAILFLGYTLNAIVSASTNLKIAKEDAFESIHSLRQARALSYMANADESRYLLDIANKDKHERAFNSKIAKLVTLPPGGKSLADVLKTIPVTAGDQKFQLSGFTGLYAEQLKNITFEGELAETVAALQKLDNYLKIDTEIRQLARSGKIAEAIALCTGRSNDVFDEYKAANEKVRLINEQVFEAKIAAGNERLSNFEIIALTAIGSIAILTLFGLRPRLAEYL